mmetsp:Transcript_18901/g.40910  ORF Transcript_18901/g.40910 Transcript_18901/m.40910 type:complete len:87 (+) Transcript_18901:1391-1651(+)
MPPYCPYQHGPVRDRLQPLLPALSWHSLEITFVYETVMKLRSRTKMGVVLVDYEVSRDGPQGIGPPELDGKAQSRRRPILLSLPLL